jgi:hypothetical protein
MKKLLAASFPMKVITLIIGISLVREFNFETLRFRHLPIALVYMFGFGLSLFLIFWGKKEKTEKTEG